MYLNYLDRGEGDVLIMLHGNGEDNLYFRSQIDYFSRTRRVIAVDTRGHGLSERGTEPFTIRQFAMDLFNLVYRNKFEKPDILGFSDGANIAMIYALEHPDRTGRLVLNGGNLNPRGVKLKYQIPITLTYLASSLASPVSRKAKKTAELMRLMVKDPMIDPEDLRRITAPTLVLAGTDDMIKEPHTRLIAGSIPGSRLEIIPGSHFVAQENPDEYNRIIEEFLSNNQ